MGEHASVIVVSVVVVVVLVLLLLLVVVVVVCLLLWLLLLLLLWLLLLVVVETKTGAPLDLFNKERRGAPLRAPPEVVGGGVGVEQHTGHQVLFLLPDSQQQPRFRVGGMGCERGGG